jgi:plasmid maintenance system antidote protein VapI
MNPNPSKIPDAIRSALQTRGWNVDDLAKAAGIRAVILDQIIAGRRRMGWQVSCKIASALGESPSAWIRLSREPIDRRDAA